MQRCPRPNSRHRPRVTSCQLCRERKLRCNRQFPCSNCTARRVTCQAPQVQTATTERAAVEKTPENLPRFSHDELLKRLESLEALIAAQTRDQEPVPLDPDLSENPDSQEAQRSPPNVLGMLSDALALERHCMSSKAGDSNVLINPVVFRTCPIRLITKPYSFIFPTDNTPSVAVPIEPIKCVWLPEREDTKRIVDKYLSDISFIHHVIHGPSVRRLVDHVHDALNQGRQPPVAPIALLLAICANATGLWTARDLSRNLFFSVPEAHAQASLWQSASFDVLDHLQQNGHVSLESTQAMIILGYSVVNLEGVSAKFRNVFSRAITMARELGLHCIDSARRLSSTNTPRFTAFEAEIGRRVWWYLCSTDWILAGLSGTLGNVCMINPSQMAVKKPTHIDDDDLAEGKDIIERPMEQPICVSFFLQRIRLAEIFRASLEKTQFAGLSPEAISFDEVRELDAKLIRFWDDAPAFMCLNHNLDPRSDNSANMNIQRYVLHLFVHGQRCKTHLPYLARGASYATSRSACVESARFIVRMEQQLEKDEANFASSRLRLSIVLHHVFLAFVVLLFDICLDADGPRHINRSPEAAAAWKILQGAKSQSQQAAVLVEPLGRVMKRYHVLHAENDTRNTALGVASSTALDSLPSGDATGEPIWLAHEWNDVGAGLMLSNDDWTESFEGLYFPLL
ncbi:hypothetical protein EDB81DRAFT_717091 [Dactylonectria macrodidyma]|uniref:Zn(2)-C6 fungal-type domain-containing protein n=1 Tax=Dactylonectria macrodidyma TaxID=307937 RepID=A0A9P9F9Y7_9HYPO|nr:hypothetical protein EDB81DRAFT_717091 [Dactylonectria macrodidyma]